MITDKTKTKKPIIEKSSRTDDTFKIAAIAIFIMAGCWVVLKLSKEMLKDLEGMGL
jgi:hypothetical protein